MFLGIRVYWRGRIAIGTPIKRPRSPASLGDIHPVLPTVGAELPATVNRMKTQTNDSARQEMDSELLRSTARPKVMRIGDQA